MYRYFLSILINNLKLLALRKKRDKNFEKKFFVCTLVVSEFMKTCDELIKSEILPKMFP